MHRNSSRCCIPRLIIPSSLGSQHSTQTTLRDRYRAGQGKDFLCLNLNPHCSSVCQFHVIHSTFARCLDALARLASFRFLAGQFRPSTKTANQREIIFQRGLSFWLPSPSPFKHTFIRRFHLSIHSSSSCHRFSYCAPNFLSGHLHPNSQNLT